MSTELVRPTSAVNTVWQDSTFSKIADAVTQPTAPSTAGGTFCEDAVQAGEQIWACAAPGNTGTVSAVKIWCYHDDDTSASENVNIRLKVNGSFLTGQQFQVGDNGSPLWTSNNFTGLSVSMTALALQIAIDDSILTKSNAIHLYCAYCEITYTAGGSGGGGGVIVNSGSWFRTWQQGADYT